MKKVIFALTLMFPLVVAAQDSDILNAQSSLKEGDKKGAIKYLRAAQQSIIGEMVSSMRESIPKKVGELELIEDQNEGMVYQSLRIEERYAVPPKDLNQEEGADGLEMEEIADEMERKELALYISDNLSEAGNVFMLHSFTEDSGPDGAEPVSVRGYKAALNNNEGWKSLEIVTGAAFIRITGQGLADSKLLMELGNTIDYEKLNQAIGN